MKERIITALVGAPIILGLAYAGGLPFSILIGLLIVLGTWEFGQMVSGQNYHFMFAVVLISQMVMLIPIYLGWENWASLGLITAFLCIFIQAVICYPKFDVADMGINFMAVLYIGWTLIHLLAIEQLPNGKMIVLYLFLAIWSSDSGAYFVGRFFGRHKLAPNLSPKKTVEGAVGGIITTIVVLELVNSILKLFTWSEIIIVGLILSLVGQLGDLVESMLKRFLGVKDSGKILPGHGGILDRFDSLILVAPFIYYTISLLLLQGVRA